MCVCTHESGAIASAEKCVETCECGQVPVHDNMCKRFFVCLGQRAYVCLQICVYVGVYMCGNMCMYVILCLCGREEGKAW